MASLSKNNRGHWIIQWPKPNMGRYTLTLTGVSRSASTSIRAHVEHLIAARNAAHAPPAATSEWLGTIGDDLYRRLVNCGLVESRKESPKTTLGAMVDTYIKGRTDLKPRTLKNLGHVRVTLVGFFGELRDIRTITKGEAGDWRREMKKTLKGPTVTTHVKKARQIFRDAVDRNLITSSVLEGGEKLASDANSSRRKYVPADVVYRVIEACPDAEWRLIFAMARFAGVRIPSEIRGLKWSDIDFAAGKMIIYSPKTEHIPDKDKRTIPIFPAVLPYLLECRATADADSTHVIVKHVGENIRGIGAKIVKIAGVEQWPRLFQNLRASCETDLTTILPLHVVCAFIGNTELVATKHYLIVKDEHFAICAGTGAGDTSGQLGTNTEHTGENAHETAETRKQLTLSGCVKGDENRLKSLANLKSTETALQLALQTLTDELPAARSRSIRLLALGVRAAKRRTRAARGRH